MFKMLKWKMILATLTAIGTIGLASFGIYNTASAYTESKKTQTTNIADVPTTSVSGTIQSGDTYRCPVGCAVCNGCTGVTYQQDATEIPGTGISLEAY